MRSRALTAALLAATALFGLSACSSTNDGPGGSGLAQSFDLGNYRRANDTNGTQTRPDVNRAYTQPTLPSIASRGL